MWCVRIVSRAFFPLDEQLALLPGNLTPFGQEGAARLAAWMPFAKAAEMMGVLCGAQVSEASVRRQAEVSGAAYVRVQEEEVTRILRELPQAEAGPAKQLLSVDGAMVPLLAGEWAEVKTLVIGVVGEAKEERGETVVRTGELSYFSRLSDAESFQHAALVETQRRGVEKAGRVIAPLDGAEWEQKFVDYHRADAVRILDFAHAAEYIGKIGAAVWGLGAPATQEWLNRTLSTLKRQGPAAVLPELRALVAEKAGNAELVGALEYLTKREAQMQYPFYQVQGWPIGSGAVESGNKVVVEARLKGAGMHWARQHVNPLLGLRNAVCNDRWAEAWSQICAYRGQLKTQKHQARCQQRQPSMPAPQQTTAPATPATSASAAPAPIQLIAPPSTQPRQPWRPPLDHPWRKFRFGKALFRRPSELPAKK